MSNRRKNNFALKLMIFIVLGISAILFLLASMGGERTVSGTAVSNSEPHDFTKVVNDNGKLELSYKGPANCYVLVTDKDEAKADDEGWKKMSDRKAVFDLTDHEEHFFLKYGNDIYDAGTNEDICDIEFKISNIDTAYLALGEDYDYELVYSVKGYTRQTPKWFSSNTNIATIDDGHLETLGNGEASITAYLLNKSAVRKVIVTDLIVKAPEEFDKNKDLLPCGLYSEEDNDLIDAILENRVAQVGYGTRAGVVEAARFLTLNFPYRIDYFYEWGRQGLDGIDGEGRYYLKGLYLDESRFKRLMGSYSGPQTWGCPLYAKAINMTTPNGLDCSGFVTWAIFNGGFDCGDLGSGITPGLKALTDIGELALISETSLIKMKVGDLLHSYYTGGHIGILIGIKDGNYYVAEATPRETVMALTVTKLNKDQLRRQWNEIVLMDSYYLEDGDLRDMWY